MRIPRHLAPALAGVLAGMLPAAAAEAPPAGPAADALVLPIGRAVLLALERNPALAVERLNPAIRRTFEDEERAIFDPLLIGALTRESGEGLRQSQTGERIFESTRDETRADLALDTRFPTGTRAALEASGTDTGAPAAGGRDLAAARVGLTVSQALLRGLGREANLARLREARLDTEISRHELRGFAEALVAEVEGTCWDYVLAVRQIEIFRESLRLAEQQRDETAERIRVGQIAAVERAAAEAEVARRREALIEAEGVRDTTRLRLARLLNPRATNAWERPLVIDADPEAPHAVPDPVADHVGLAMALRPDLAEAQLRLARQDLEIVRTRNGLLPKLDLFVTLGRTGYADSFADAPVGDENGYDVLVGVAGEFALGNRAERARHARSHLERDQAERAVENLGLLAQVDVRSAWIDLQRLLTQVEATRATRRAEEEKTRAEQEKYRVGASTALQVAQAQRDLLQSRIAEARALVGCFKAEVTLYRLDGSLLIRRGLEIAAAP